MRRSFSKISKPERSRKPTAAAKVFIASPDSLPASMSSLSRKKVTKNQFRNTSPSTLKTSKASTSFWRPARLRLWLRLPPKPPSNSKPRKQISIRQSPPPRSSDCHRRVAILTSWHGSRREFSVTQDAIRTEVQRACQTPPDQAAQTSRSSRLRTNRRSPRMVNASRQTIFRSTA